MSKEESRALNIIRWLSTFAIVLCHILQGYGSQWAYVSNIGVQIFLFLSGFLYGNKRIADVKQFYKKRVVKLYIPYAIWVVTTLLLIYFFSDVIVTFVDAARHLALRVSNITALAHLWFMFVIFACYLILPVFEYFISKKRILTISLFTLCIAVILSVRYSPTFLWIALYYVGYIYGRFPNTRLWITMISIIGAIAIMWRSHFALTAFGGDEIFSNSLHAFCGIVIFDLLLRLLRITPPLRQYLYYQQVTVTRK